MSLRTITPAEVQALIAAGGPVDLIDVRTTGEYTAVHAVGAQHAPLSGLDPAAVIASRKGAAADPVYIICKSGGRSSAACSAFIKAGIGNVCNVTGGTDAWIAAGLPVARNAGAATAGLLRQALILGVAFAAVAFLAPCSPWTLWPSAYCPAGPATATATAPVAVPPGVPGFDFAREVVAASAASPVLVDFNATWCGPCKLLAPELARLAGERTGTLTLVKLDVDQHREVAASQGVNSIPDVRLWKNGREVARFVGFRPHAELVIWLDQALAAL